MSRRPRSRRVHSRRRTPAEGCSAKGRCHYAWSFRRRKCHFLPGHDFPKNNRSSMTRNRIRDQASEVMLVFCSQFITIRAPNAPVSERPDQFRGRPTNHGRRQSQLDDCVNIDRRCDTAQKKTARPRAQIVSQHAKVLVGHRTCSSGMASGTARGLCHILQVFQRSHFDDVAGRLRLEDLLFLRKRVDSRALFGGGLVLDHDLAQAGNRKHARYRPKR